MERDNRRSSLLAESLRAHALIFEKPLAPKYEDAIGLRILVAFVMVGIGLFFVLRLVMDVTGMGGSPASKLAFVAVLMAAFFLVQKSFVGLSIAGVGLRRFADWTLRERLYLLQVAAMAIVIFTIVFSIHLLALLHQHGPAGFLLFSVVTGLLWGMVQEFLYRGWLQTELTRRFGAAVGLLAANIVFTFGPLHLNYLVGSTGVHWDGLAAVFCIGLLFGVLYLRSGNLWIPAVLHGLWPLNMT